MGVNYDAAELGPIDRLKSAPSSERRDSRLRVHQVEVEIVRVHGLGTNSAEAASDARSTIADVQRPNRRANGNQDVARFGDLLRNAAVDARRWVAKAEVHLALKEREPNPGVVVCRRRGRLAHIQVSNVGEAWQSDTHLGEYFP